MTCPVAHSIQRAWRARVSRRGSCQRENNTGHQQDETLPSEDYQDSVTTTGISTVGVCSPEVQPAKIKVELSYSLFGNILCQTVVASVSSGFWTAVILHLGIGVRTVLTRNAQFAHKNAHFQTTIRKLKKKPSQAIWSHFASVFTKLSNEL